jgi:hypothetical protein
MKTYKVSCEFYIKAENETQAEEIVSDDFCSGDFMEEHIMIEESELPDGEVCFNAELYFNGEYY